MTTVSWHIRLANEFIVNPHFTSVCMRALWLQSCLTLCDPMDCSPPGSSVHEILQTRILEWVAVPSSGGSSPPRNWTCVSCIAGGFITAEPRDKSPFPSTLLYLVSDAMAKFHHGWSSISQLFQRMNFGHCYTWNKIWTQGSEQQWSRHNIDANCAPC